MIRRSAFFVIALVLSLTTCRIDSPAASPERSSSHGWMACNCTAGRNSAPTSLTTRGADRTVMAAWPSSRLPRRVAGLLVKELSRRRRPLPFFQRLFEGSPTSQAPAAARSRRSRGWMTVDTRVEEDRPVVANYLEGMRPIAEMEYPANGPDDARGWSEVRATYKAPAQATIVRVDLQLMWAPGGRVESGVVTLAQSESPLTRLVRLAAVHYLPKGGTSNADKAALFAPLITEAARQRADLVVLPETLTYYDSGRMPVDVAEPIPGPTTEYFGKVAKHNNLYIVAGLYERANNLVYNVAVLIGPDGSLVGKFRKVTLPTNEGRKTAFVPGMSILFSTLVLAKSE